MQPPSSRSLRRLSYLEWLPGFLVLGILGAVAVWLPNPFSLALVAIALVVAALLLKPGWVLMALLLLRSSTDLAQSVVTIFPGQWYSLNAAGAFNILAVGIGGMLLARRFARRQELLPSAPLKLYALFLAVTAVGILPSIDSTLSVKEWSRLAGSLGVALLVLETVHSEKDVRTVLRIITLAALPPLLLGYFQAVTGSGYFFEGWAGTLFGFRPQGTFGHPAALATFLILVASIALVGYINTFPLWPRLVLLALTGASLGLLLLTYSRTEWIACLVGLGALAVLRYRRLLVIGAVAILVAVVALPTVQTRLGGEQASESYDWRLEVWDASLTILHEPTLIGSGLDTSSILINKQLPRVFTPPHNDYLKVTIEAGILGAVIYGLLQLGLLSLGWRAFRQADRGQSTVGLILLIATISGLVISLADNYLGYTSVQWYYWTVVAVCAAARSGYPAISISSHMTMEGRQRETLDP